MSRRTLGHALAFLGLAAALTVGLASYAHEQSADVGAVLRANQLAGCERGNKLRAESNRRVPAHVADRDVLEEFLAAAKKARLVAGRQLQDANDLRAARAYAHLRRVLIERVRFEPLPLVDCQRAIRRP